MSAFDRYFITGGTGFIGANLVRSLVAQGNSVHLLVRETSSLWRLSDIQDKIELHYGDLLDLTSLTDCVSGAQPQVIIHLGGGSMGQPWNVDFDDMQASIDLNLIGTVNLLKAVKQSAVSLLRFVRMGGLLEYGDGPTPFIETQREQPISVYAATQVATTVIINSLHRGLDYPLVSLRLASVYGPGRDLHFFVPALICAAIKGQDFEMTSGKQIWDMLYVDDAIDAILATVNSDCTSGEIINIGSGEAHSLRDIAQTIVANIPSAGQLKIGAKPEPDGGIANLTCNIEKAKTYLNWRPRTAFDDGIKATIAWYRANINQFPHETTT